MGRTDYFLQRRGANVARRSLVRRDRADRGAALVEAALILPIFVLLVLAVLEGGRVLLGHQTMGAGTSGAARSASLAANDINADYLILQSIHDATQGRIKADSIERIVIFKATSSTDTVPPQCLASGSQSDLCNVYDGSSFAIDEADIATCDPPSPARFWCPSDRKYAAQNDNGNGPPDWIGVYIEADFDLVTGVFGEQIRFEDTKVTRIEARSIV